MSSVSGSGIQMADGPAFVGIFFNVLLYGVMVTQISFYFSMYRSDPKWMKLYVTILFTLDSLNAIFNIWWMYNALINNYGNLAALGISNWILDTQEVLADILSLQVQLYYAWHIHQLTGKLWLVVIIVVPSIIGDLSGIATALGVAISFKFVGLPLKVMHFVGLSGTVVGDSAIAFALIWHKCQIRSENSQIFPPIAQVVQLTVSNGSATALFALANLIAYGISTTFYLVFNYTLRKLYGNSILSLFNARLLSTSSEMGSARFGSTGRSTTERNSNLSHILSMTASKRLSKPTKTIGDVETYEMAERPSSTMKVDDAWVDENRGSTNVVTEMEVSSSV